MYKKYIPFLLLLISTLSFGQNIHFQAIGVENGISQPTVTSIYQDEFGIIWIGTKDGLNRYNGTDFHIFRPIENDKNSLYNNNIGTMAIKTVIFISVASMLQQNMISEKTFSILSVTTISRPLTTVTPGYGFVREIHCLHTTEKKINQSIITTWTVYAYHASLKIMKATCMQER